MKLTVVVAWDDDPKTGCTAVVPELDISARGSDPIEARDNVERETRIWLLKHSGAIPLKAIIYEIDVPFSGA